MTSALVFGAVWVVAATITALLPIRWQTAPGLLLLAAAPVLLVWIGSESGWIWTVIGLLAFLSMFRNPLRYLFSRLTGRPFVLPPEVLARISPEEAARHPRLAEAKAALNQRAAPARSGGFRREAPAAEPAAATSPEGTAP